MKMIRKLARRFRDFLDRHSYPFKDELVLRLVLHTSSLEMAPTEFREFAPLPGCCGPFKLSGSSLPVFQYIVFEKSIMEFIDVRVEVSRPERIEYSATINSTTAPERHGETVKVKEIYKDPFIVLSRHLFRYFPLFVLPEKRNVNR